MKKFLSLFLASFTLFSFLLGTTITAAESSFSNFKVVRTYTSKTFEDVQSSSWYYESVRTAYELGLMNGSGATKFSPANSITVAETLALACRIHSIYTNDGHIFQQGNPWYQCYIDYANDHDIVMPKIANYTSSNPTLPAADMETNQVAQTIKANVGVESKADAPVGYLLDLSYTNFSYKYGYSKEHDAPSEGTFNLDFGLSSGFGGNQRVGLNGNFQYFNYSLPSELKSPETKDPSTYFDNFAAATLNPYYKIEGDNWHVKLGVNAMFFSGEQKKFMASPNISADVEVADKTVLYLNANGKLQSNSMYDVNRINRYANPLERLTPSRNWLDGILGIKSGVAPGFWFDVFGGYKIVSNNYFFVPTLAYGDKDYFGSACGMMNEIDTKQLLVGANLKYSYQQLFEISLKGVYNNWTAEYSDKYSETDLAGKDATAWGMPEMEITAGVTVRPINNLSASLDYYLATGREARLGEKNVKMDNINELNLTGAYNFNDTFGLYLKLNNVLFQKYELYYGYPLQKFSAMIGVNINF